MGAGKGGDGGEESAVAPEAAQPVVLRVDLHCAGCAHKVKKAIKRVPGVDSIVTDVATNRVVVAGTADAGALKARLEAKTSKPVEILSAPKKPPAAEPKQQQQAAAAQGDKGVSPKEEGKEKKQEPAEEKPKQETVLLKIRLHCDGCADRIRRRIYKIKGVKDVVVDGNAKKDEVQVTGTMDVPHMVAYLKEKLNRDVEAVAAAAPAKKDGGGGEGKDDKKDSAAGGGDKSKGLAVAGGDGSKDKGKGIEAVSAAAGPSTAAAAAFMAAPAGASTYHVAPPYGYVAYQQQPPPPPPSAGYYPAPAYPYYAAAGNGDGGMAHHGNNPGGAAGYYQQVQQDGYGNQQPQMAYPPYPYRFDMAPPPQLFSDENPNACSVM